METGTLFVGLLRTYLYLNVGKDEREAQKKGREDGRKEEGNVSEEEAEKRKEEKEGKAKKWEKSLF